MICGSIIATYEILLCLGMKDTFLFILSTVSRFDRPSPLIRSLGKPLFSDGSQS